MTNNGKIFMQIQEVNQLLGLTFGPFFCRKIIELFLSDSMFSFGFIGDCDFRVEVLIIGLCLLTIDKQHCCDLNRIIKWIPSSLYIQCIEARGISILLCL